MGRRYPVGRTGNPLGSERRASGYAQIVSTPDIDTNADEPKQSKEHGRNPVTGETTEHPVGTHQATDNVENEPPA
ncbi:MAG: hypothetical protein JWN62_4445 [Acidimicrobiales bacterium]|nr:hypothetical protein [Acidimicrobiales bacterium]